MAKHNRYTAYYHNSKVFKYDLASQQSNSIEPDQWPSRCSSIRTDPSYKAHPPSSKLHAIPKRDWNTILYKTRINDHNKPFKNQNDFQKQRTIGGHCRCRMTIHIDNASFLEQTDKTSFSKNGTEMMLATYKRSSFILHYRRMSKNKNTVNSGWVEPDSN